MNKRECRGRPGRDAKLYPGFWAWGGGYRRGVTRTLKPRILGHLDTSPKKARILGHLETGGYESTIYIDSTILRQGSLAAWWHPHKGGGGLRIQDLVRTSDSSDLNPK